MIFGKINAWRANPIFKPKFNNVLPGFLPAVALFSVYCVAEYVYDNFDSKPKIQDKHH